MTSRLAADQPGRARREPSAPAAYIIDGVLLRKLRHKHGLSQEALAWNSGVGLSTLGALERTRYPRCRGWTTARLATALDSDVYALIIQPVRCDDRRGSRAIPADNTRPA
jgi:DNA-binding XRE family transcriptional regulator